jgi:hypothetical protein
MENNEVKILRFKDGLDIICTMAPMGDDIQLDSPMVFEVRNTNLVLQQWLPLSVMKGTSVNVNRGDVLCIIEPNEDFAEYYSNTIGKMKSALASKEHSEQAAELREVVEAMVEMESTRNLLIH